MEVKIKMEIGEKNLDLRPTSMWSSKGLAIMGMLVVLMVHCRVVIGVVVAPVESPGGPIKTELILGVAATQPVKPYFRIFCLTRHNCVFSDAGGGGVVSLKGRRWLRPMYFNECLA